MTQNFSLYSDLTVYENLQFIARVYQMVDYRRDIDEVLDKLKFSAIDRRKLAGKLSGGWKQKLSLAAAMLHRPQLLLLDEPTSGVDPQARREFWEIIHELAEQGMTVLVSTHYLDEIDHCHRLTYIADGYILTTGAISEIIDQAQLSLWVVTGDDLPALAHELRELAGVDQATVFGEKLHVVGKNTQKLRATIAPYQTNKHQWQQRTPDLEDVFIYLVAKSKEQHLS